MAVGPATVLCIAHAGDEIADGVSERHGREELPGRIFETGNVAVDGKFPEADAADAEETHVAAFATTELASSVDASRELHFLARSSGLLCFRMPAFPADDECVSSHT